MTSLYSLIKKRPNLILLVVFLIGANIVAWLWALTAFSHNTSLLALSLIAWCYGLRHAVDADHIAAIDSATRKLMQQNKRALTTGAWFSLGHSTIVVLASMGIALTTSVFKQHMVWFQNIGGIIGTTVSAAFLLILATINLIIFFQVWKAFRHLKRTGIYDLSTEDVTVSGPLNWLFRSAFRLVGKDWHMYFVGFLFGLGFDTATEISLLGISASSASNGMSVWSILVFPALFTCGMALIDCLDSILMVEAYGWAFNKPQRKLYYNMTITGTSVIVALFIGGLEGLGLLSDAFSLQGGLWDTVSNLSDHMGNVGFVIIGVFIACWIISALNYRWKKYDGLTFS
ncbi:HoxN/HupN/NixA family nickel/cobalt transporter [Citrobacter sp. FDAARGOS_156]|uniref:HoxN/HupN/NixA family nickel/cobalt transporter n=1 Tax=Citrobacter TaxID=544 RepID=UPI000E1377D5|nr:MULTISPECIES: HoxN/HupN/NixA family nickel/cobalt transporter [Citrobacter]EIS7446595.1 HoxN/HupN/NixA family nickel/cobalt transporter [Citrobacter youngae]MBJ9158758.1 HoxN/HupN/NixA family nickel/cobalt transporter [Citrobacter sp. FDAARGOS_156]MBJ9640406.1 HoxN/HupN/NixA family nickel/cobalt transporter [Citrobacter sp. FDAARGOS_156]SUY01216.1 High-affinity nickel transport protein [Citrobacter youngae]